MAKSKNSAYNILWLSICLCIFIATPVAGDIPCIQRTYNSQIGVYEATGKNDGPQVEEYLSSVGRKKGDAWCAAFVHWVLSRCDVNDIPFSGWSPSWFTKNVIYKRGGKSNQTPQTGDVFGLYFLNLKRVAHVGFIDRWTDGSDYCITVEGNTSDANTGNATREGGGVYKKRRLKRQIYIVSRWVK